ncbi:hypothetical protein JOD69_004979 [Methylocaldum sp. RMAD-M]|nr:hypothetical protein [Methylocaldum sp. RMAD-M]
MTATVATLCHGIGKCLRFGIFADANHQAFL